MVPMMMARRAARPGRPTRLRVALLGCTALLAVTAGCAGTGTAAPAPAPTPANDAPSAAAAPTSAPAPSPHSSGSHTAAPDSPQDAALQLESLLGQHAVLAADMMRGRIRNDEDFGQAAEAAISRNTDDMGAIVGSLFGDQAAGQFRTIWADHVTALFNYARGVAIDDAAVRAEAQANLVDYENDIADFFAGASQGRLPRDAARSVATAHIEHLVGQADAYAAKDYTRSNELYRVGFAHAVELGRTLGATLLPPDQAAQLARPQWRLRSELDRLLGEHVALAVGALRGGATNAPDFPAAAASLNANTNELSGAVATLFGEAAGQQFLALWADHIDQLVAYTAGVAGNDPDKRRQAEANLRTFEGRLSEFLTSATGNRLASDALAKGLLAHDDTLLRGVDAFVAKDYTQAQDVSYTTYQDMFGLSRELSNAFGETVAERLPQGGAQTGAGGLVRSPRPK